MTTPLTLAIDSSPSGKLAAATKSHWYHWPTSHPKGFVCVRSSHCRPLSLQGSFVYGAATADLSPYRLPLCTERPLPSSLAKGFVCVRSSHCRPLSLQASFVYGAVTADSLPTGFVCVRSGHCRPLSLQASFVYGMATAGLSR